MLRPLRPDLPYLQQPDLSEGDLPYERVVLGLHELLDGHDLAGLPVTTLEHHAVATLAELAELLVALHQPGRGARPAHQHTTGQRRVG